VIYNTHLFSNLCRSGQTDIGKDGTQYNTGIICYATCADEVDSYTTHLLLQLGRLGDAIFMCYK